MTGLERAVVALAALFVGIVGFLWAFDSPPDRGPVGPLISQAVERGYLPCENEGSPGPCYWDASRSGNREGLDFVVTADQEVFFEGQQWN